MKHNKLGFLLRYLCYTLSTEATLPLRQSVVCGHGTRYRNLTCFVSDGSADGDSSVVDEELCGGLELAVDGDKQIVLKEACVLPCPGGWGSSLSLCQDLIFVTNCIN